MFYRVGIGEKWLIIFVQHIPIVSIGTLFLLYNKMFVCEKGGVVKPFNTLHLTYTGVFHGRLIWESGSFFSWAWVSFRTCCTLSWGAVSSTSRNPPWVWRVRGPPTHSGVASVLGEGQASSAEKCTILVIRHGCERGGGHPLTQRSLLF